MMRLTFEIDGRPVEPHDFEDAVERAVLESIEHTVRSKLAGIRDPETGEFPVVALRGNGLDNLSFELSGSPRLIAMVRERVGDDTDDEYDLMEAGAPISTTVERASPCVFLCHASEDKELARKIALEFQTQGIETFFDEWEIGPGDSLRQKIDDGLDRCTHFVVLLTPKSLPKPWVKAEMDAGFVKKVDGKCRFIAVRSGLSPDKLPPLLRGLHSPSTDDRPQNLLGLVNFIHGVTTRPPLGPAPRVIREAANSKTGLSPAAEMIARLMIERSEHGDDWDPQLEMADLRETTGLPEDDILDAVDELEGRGFVVAHALINSHRLGTTRALFAALDQHFTDWNPEADALRIAADLVNDAVEGIVSDMAQSYGWSPRRMNPAITYLAERKLIDCSTPIGVHPWCAHWIAKNHNTRRFVRDRS